MLKPNFDDLLNITALLLKENYQMRTELGHNHNGLARQFTDHDLTRGRSLGPCAQFVDGGSLEVRLES